MGFLNVSPIFSRLSKYTTTCMRNISTYGYPLQFGITNTLLAEPLKKKKRLDPAILREREERKKKKLEKFIRRLEKHSKQLKPIGELEIPLYLKTEKEERTRKLLPLSEEEEDRRILLQKEWSRYKQKQYLDDIRTIDRFISSQNKALQELKAESEELYNEAIQASTRVQSYPLIEDNVIDVAVDQFDFFSQ
ncbi:39S ribosomal protein L40, mitochondrial isoform X2 [Polistes fuscatus]|uniref:39S ribosomal protein L40, mitochondrial isoform X2 n=1 Tax=Polistes fuscatus TaxID=30207 RepID=UPI001CA862B4|nr:39S ribosomal protein L40, mitochondrial isoform X2 [Polistes fuscatus]